MSVTESDRRMNMALLPLPRVHGQPHGGPLRRQDCVDGLVQMLVEDGFSLSVKVSHVSRLAASKVAQARCQFETAVEGSRSAPVLWPLGKDALQQRVELLYGQAVPVRELVGGQVLQHERPRHGHGLTTGTPDTLLHQDQRRSHSTRSGNRTLSPPPTRPSGPSVAVAREHHRRAVSPAV